MRGHRDAHVEDALQLGDGPARDPRTRFATISTSPSAANRVSASRTGVRLTPSRSAEVRDRVTRHTPSQIVRNVGPTGSWGQRSGVRSAQLHTKEADVADLLSTGGTPRARLRELISGSA